MAKEKCSGHLESNIKESGSKVSLLVMANCLSKMEAFTKENGSKTDVMVKGHLLVLRRLNMSGNGRMICKMDRVRRLGQRDQSMSVTT